MRRVNLGNPHGGPSVAWLFQAVKDIENASFEADPNEVADGFTIENLTPTYTLDVATATAGDVAAVLGTFLQDLKNRGQKRTA